MELEQRPVQGAVEAGTGIEKLPSHEKQHQQRRQAEQDARQADQEVAVAQKRRHVNGDMVHGRGGILKNVRGGLGIEAGHQLRQRHRGPVQGKPLIPLQIRLAEVV